MGIDCINYKTDLELFERAVKVTKSLNIKIFAWIPTLLGVGKPK
jgi:hypothetical protein